METPPEVAKERVARLTNRQRFILRLKLKPVKEKEIAEQTGIAVGTVKATYNQALSKLDLLKYPLDLRNDILCAVYEPILATYFPEPEPGRLPPPSPEDEGVNEAPEVGIDDDWEAILIAHQKWQEEQARIREQQMRSQSQSGKSEEEVVEGEYVEIITPKPTGGGPGKTKPKLLTGPGGERKDDRGRDIGFYVLLGLVLPVVACLCVASGWVAAQVPGWLNPDPTQAVVATATAITQVEVVTQVVEITPTPAPGEPTQQEPEPTQGPSNTPVPSATTRPTNIPDLFMDNFDRGPSEAWSIEYGSPIVVDGMLSASSETLMIVGDASWQNYSVRFQADGADCWFAGSVNYVGVHVQDFNNMLVFRWADCEADTFIVQNGKWTEVPNASKRGGLLAYGIVNWRVDVEDNLYTFYLDGSQIFSVFDSTFSNGGVALLIAEETQIDNFRVTPH